MSLIALQWLGAWLLFLLAQAIFINGIKTSSAGETEMLPNGEELDSEMILYPLKKWAERSYIEKVYYTGHALKELAENAMYKFPFFTQNHVVNNYNISLNSDDDMHGIKQGREHVEKAYNLKIEFGEGRNISFYKEYKRYKVHAWIRKPLIQCIKCMSSFWSLFTYWPPIILFFGFEWWQIPLWVANVVSLSWLNWYIFNKQS